MEKKFLIYNKETGEPLFVSEELSELRINFVCDQINQRVENNYSFKPLSEEEAEEIRNSKRIGPIAGDSDGK